MKKLILSLSVVLSVSCILLPPITPVGTPNATEPPTVTETVIPDTVTPSATYDELTYWTLEPSETPTSTATATATETPSATIDPSPTPIVPSVTVPPSRPNLLPNAGMELYDFVWVCQGDDCERHLVPVGYSPYYCGINYTPEPCPAPRIGTGNPEGLIMRRPEWKIAAWVEYPNRVHSGSSAGQWFCFFGSCQAGLYVTVPTAPGALCEVGAWRQAWNNYDDDIESEESTQDDRDNVQHRIQVNLDGKTFAFAEDNLSSRWFGYDDFRYDTWGLTTYQFVANSYLTTVFFESMVLFPIANNDVYLDDVYMRCTE